MMSTKNIHCDLDFDSNGKRVGSLDLQYSDNKHAFDKIPIPIAVIRNGEGPTVLLTAGNHGDEYEGQVILRRLIHDVNPQDICGRLILLPALNYPAMLDNARISPLDQGNLNRSFPGDENGLPTAAIAHFVTRKLLPLADAGIDLHSGGSGTYYVPSAFLCVSDKPEILQQSLAMAEAFNAPYTIVVKGDESLNGLDPVAHSMNIPFISTELAGGANVDVQATHIGMTGVKNVLYQFGVLLAKRDWDVQTRYVDCINQPRHLSVPFSGIFESFHELGDCVTKGQIAGKLYSLEEVERPPLELVFENSGIIMVRRNGARVRRGAHVFLVAEEIDRDNLL